VESDRVPAKFVFHLFREDRPGQHRAVSELGATLGLFGAGRRWREATITAAENVADFAMLMKTNSSPDEVSEVPAFDTMEINKGMLTALPYGYEPYQPKAEQPSATYGEFNRSLMCEQARPLNMPYNIAAADSSDYSFSGGRLDHLTYFVSVDTDQADIEDTCLDLLFALWWEEAVRLNQWTLSVDTVPAHDWVWPAKPQIDDQKTASARQTALSTGTTSLRRIYNEDGLDLEDEMAAMAEDYGVSVEEIRRKLYEVNFQRPSVAPSSAPSESDAKPRPNPFNRPPARNGNGRQPAGAAQ
jgi:capsid protein